MGARTDLTGMRFGRLVAINYIPDRRRSGGVGGKWVARCDCGAEVMVRAYLLVSGKQVSCGCYRRERAAQRQRTHGKTGTFEFNVWTAMKKRCQYPKHPKYPLYGGRGIKVCERWGEFANFLEDMGECPIPNGSIERLDNNKGYQPDNCVWLAKSAQSKNRRRKK